MFLIPAHCCKPSSSSLSHFLVFPGHVSHVLPDLTYAFFSCPDGDLPSHACNGGFCYLGCCVSHVTVATAPGTRLCPEPRWPCQGHCRPTSLKPCRCLLFLLVPIFAVEPGKLGASGASTVWRAPLPRHSWALESGQVTLISECSLPSCSPSMGIIQYKHLQPCLTLELLEHIEKYQCLTCALRVWINMPRSQVSLGSKNLWVRRLSKQPAFLHSVQQGGHPLNKVFHLWGTLSCLFVRQDTSIRGQICAQQQNTSDSTSSEINTMNTVDPTTHRPLDSSKVCNQQISLSSGYRILILAESPKPICYLWLNNVKALNANKKKMNGSLGKSNCFTETHFLTEEPKCTENICSVPASKDI